MYAYTWEVNNCLSRKMGRVGRGRRKGKRRGVGGRVRGEGLGEGSRKRVWRGWIGGKVGDEVEKGERVGEGL